MPEVVGGGITVPSEDGGIVMGDDHVALGEGGGAVSIAELANGEERGVEAVEDISLGCFSGEARDGEGANRVGVDSGAIGHRDGDGVMLGGHIGKARCGGRKEMAGGAGVSYGGGSSYRWGRGINWVGLNRFI